MRRRSLSVALGAVCALQLAGCASIVTGSNQPVSVETIGYAGQPIPGASCKLTNDKGSWFITTPGSTTVQRSYGDLAVQCEKQPHAPGIVTVGSTTKAMAFGNILIGGILGAGVDAATGAAYDYPSLIQVRMPVTEVAGPTPTLQPAVQRLPASSPAHWVPASCEWSTPGLGLCPPK